jgi:hypothetical protein
MTRRRLAIRFRPSGLGSITAILAEIPITFSLSWKYSMEIKSGPRMNHPLLSLFRARCSGASLSGVCLLLVLSSATHAIPDPPTCCAPGFVKTPTLNMGNGQWLGVKSPVGIFAGPGNANIAGASYTMCRPTVATHFSAWGDGAADQDICFKAIEGAGIEIQKIVDVSSAWTVSSSMAKSLTHNPPSVTIEFQDAVGSMTTTMTAYEGYGLCNAGAETVAASIQTTVIDPCAVIDSDNPQTQFGTLPIPFSCPVDGPYQSENIWPVNGDPNACDRINITCQANANGNYGYQIGFGRESYQADENVVGDIYPKSDCIYKCGQNVIWVETKRTTCGRRRITKLEHINIGAGPCNGQYPHKSYKLISDDGGTPPPTLECYYKPAIDGMPGTGGGTLTSNCAACNEPCPLDWGF